MSRKRFYINCLLYRWLFATLHFLKKFCVFVATNRAFCWILKIYLAIFVWILKKLGCLGGCFVPSNGGRPVIQSGD